MNRRSRLLTNITNEIYSSTSFKINDILDIKSFYNIQNGYDMFQSIRHNTKRAFFGMNENKQIICVSKYWEEVCGYDQEEVAGLKPSFLQGKETNLEVVNNFENSLSENGISEAVIVNYTKNNNKFLNNLQVITVNHNDNLETNINTLKYIAEVRVL